MSNHFSPHQFDAVDGYYGPNQEFGGQYVPETLLPSLHELTEAFNHYKNDPEFLAELADLQTNFVGRPSPLVYAANLTKQYGGAKIYLKNEGGNLTGSHKINHCIFQGLLAKRLGKTRVICETGAGQHGIAVATICAKLGLECVVYMGTKDIAKQYPNVFFIKRMGATIVPVTNGQASLVEAVDAALADYITNPDSYYMLGSAVGPAPYPEIIREAQRVVGEEIKAQLFEREGKLPAAVVACIGGGSNAIGAFNAFLYDESVRLIGVEAAGKGMNQPGGHSSRIASTQGKTSIMQGFKSYFLLDEQGQSLPLHSISVGLKYSGIGPLHAYLSSVGRLEVTAATDAEVLEVFQLLAQKEGIIAALESTHALVGALKLAPELPKNQSIVVNISGRGDNYLFNIAAGLGDKEFEAFCHEYKI